MLLLLRIWPDQSSSLYFSMQLTLQAIGEREYPYELQKLQGDIKC